MPPAVAGDMLSAMRWMVPVVAVLSLVAASCTTNTTCGCLCDEGGIIAHCSSGVVSDGSSQPSSDGGTE